MSHWVKFRGVLFAASLAFVDTAQAREILDAATLTKFLDPLPNPKQQVIAPSGTLGGLPLYEVDVSQFQQQLHSQLPASTLWGYNGMYPGPTFDLNRDQAINVRWTNNLRDGLGQPLKHFLPYDSTLHGADYPDAHDGDHDQHGPQPDFPQARVVTHLHGGVVDERSDGYPEHWFTPDPHAPPNGMGGPSGNQLVTTYPNDQRSAGMWYHDHAMAITRLNIYAGMAGFYLLRDELESALNLPKGDYEIPLMIQDKSFYDNGELYYPGADDAGHSNAATHVASFFGDANLVNGKVWPYLEVEPRKYRFRMLNAANSRSYNLSLVPDPGSASQEPVTLHQIGTDGGLFSHRVERESMLLMPADRADVIVDFSQFNSGDTLRLMNDALAASEGTTDQVMQFRIKTPAGPDTSSLPDALVPLERFDEADALRTRQLRLVRGFDSMGRVQMKLDGKLWTDPVSEILTLGQPEIWEISNSTGDDHPIHLHLEAFQILGRSGPTGEIPLAPHELGWEDTVAVFDGQSVRIMVKYEKFAGTFVWHCHLLEHEDHEMMRPFRVVPEPGPLPMFLALMIMAGCLASRSLRTRRRSRQPRKTAKVFDVSHGPDMLGFGHWGRARSICGRRRH
jgi:spore coat protein A